MQSGGGVKRETLISTPGGQKQGRRPDIIIELEDGKKVYGNVRRTKTDETPVFRELSAMNDLETKTIGNDIPDDVQFRAYCPCTPKRAK